MIFGVFDANVNFANFMEESFSVKQAVKRSLNTGFSWIFFGDFIPERQSRHSNRPTSISEPNMSSTSLKPCINKAVALKRGGY